MAYHKLSIFYVILVIGIFTVELCQGTGVQELRDPNEQYSSDDGPKAGGKQNLSNEIVIRKLNDFTVL